MSERPNIETSAALDERLREILVHGPLYRKFIYTGNECHFSGFRGTAHQRFGKLPWQLKMYCDHKKCESLTWWEVINIDVYFLSDYIHQAVYRCKNCGDRYGQGSTQYYQFIWQEQDGFNIFIKVGQFPALSIEPSPELAKALGAEDVHLYKKGLIDFNFGHGIGAVAYFRRVLENKINALLDLIVEAARNAKLDEHLVEIEAVKKSHRVEDKIDVAAAILPIHLKPGGHNPLDKLYRPLSAGLHGESDDDCLTIFSEARFVFEYLFKNLTESNEEARNYILRLSAAKTKVPAEEPPA